MNGLSRATDVADRHQAWYVRKFRFPEAGNCKLERSFAVNCLDRDPKLHIDGKAVTLPGCSSVELLTILCRGERVVDVYLPFRLVERESAASAYQKKRGENSDIVFSRNCKTVRRLVPESPPRSG